MQVWQALANPLIIILNVIVLTLIQLLRQHVVLCKIDGPFEVLNDNVIFILGA